MPILPPDERPVFRLVPESDFSYRHLREYPVWSEFYDPEERDEIIGWGIDAEWLDQELARHHHGSDHAVYPLLERNPFPARMRIFIRARFRTAGGQSLSGWIVNEDASPSVWIVQDGKEFGFNRNLPDWADDDARALRRSLPDPTDPVFPLAFEADFTDATGEMIRGTFDFDSA